MIESRDTTIGQLREQVAVAAKDITEKDKKYEALKKKYFDTIDENKEVLAMFNSKSKKVY